MSAKVLNVDLQEAQRCEQHGLRVGYLARAPTLRVRSADMEWEITFQRPTAATPLGSPAAHGL